MTMQDSPTSAADVPAQPPQPRCANCGASLLGEHCHACGQPVRGLVRHFSSILGDFVDSVFNVDSRILRTLGPLFFRPGRLSNEYFAGRRVRYVSPVRLFVFLCIAAFFVAQLSADWGGGGVDVSARDRGGDGAFSIHADDFAQATTVAEVERVRDEALAELAQARKEAGAVPGVGIGLRRAETAVREDARRRIEALRKATSKRTPAPAKRADADADAAPRAADDEKPARPKVESGKLQFGDLSWDPERNPVAVDWLPGFANAWLNRQAKRTLRNVDRIEDDPNLFKDALLGAIPTTLFALLPLFALMLKLLYVFRRRLYMEHLIVALHSHAFLCLALLLAIVVADLQEWVGYASGFAGLLGVILAAVIIWMPLYLLLMQKRVYGQGWAMTLLKYFVLGNCYLVLLGFGASFAAMAALVWM